VLGVIHAAPTSPVGALVRSASLRGRHPSAVRWSAHALREPEGQMAPQVGVTFDRVFGARIRACVLTIGPRVSFVLAI